MYKVYKFASNEYPCSDVNGLVVDYPNGEKYIIYLGKYRKGEMVKLDETGLTIDFNAQNNVGTYRLCNPHDHGIITGVNV